MVLLLCLIAPALAPAQIDPGPTDHIRVTADEHMMGLDWSDTDDVLRGAIQPAPLSAHRPFTVTLRIEPVSGKPYRMPVVMTLRRMGEQVGKSLVVPRGAGQTGWSATFTPGDAGPYELDILFRTTRAKVLHAGFTVMPGGVPWWAWVALAAVLLAALLFFWRARRQEVRPAPDTAR